MKKLLALLFLVKGLVFSQVYPTDTTLTIVNYNPPTPLPSYLVTFTEENFGNKVTRVSDEIVFGIGDQIQKRHAYSKRQVWNSDGSYIILAGNNPKLLDGTNYSLVASVLSFGNMGWSNTDRLVSYQTSGSSNYFQKRLLNETTYTISTIFTKIFTNYNILSHHSSEANVSADDKYIALYGTKSATGSDCWVVVYDIEIDSIYSETNLGVALSSIDWVSMSQSGNYVVILFNSDGSGSNQGTKSYDKNMNLISHITNRTSHGDLGYDINGNEVLVSNSSNYIRSYRLDGVGSPVIYAYISGGHVSCRNIDRPGWAYVNDHGASSSPTDYESFREVFAVKLDNKPGGKITVERFTKHYSDINPGYYHQPHAVVNKNGTKVLFASNMEVPSVVSQNYSFAWVVEAPQNSLPMANAGADKSVCLGDSIQLTATGNGTYLWSTGDNTASIWVTPSTTTNYIVTVTNANGNDKDTAIVSIDSNLCAKMVCFNSNSLTIDGVEENLWSGAYQDTLGRLISGSSSGNSDISGIFKLMWDNTNLYVLANITDDIKTNDSPDEWNDDGIEIFIDGNNEKNVVYDANDRQYIIRWNDNTVYEHGFNSGTNPVGVTFAQTNTLTGYIIEGEIAWSSIGVSPSNGKNIGFEIQLNDDDDGGTSLEARRSWYALVSPSADASLMGLVELSASVCNNTTSVGNRLESDIHIYPNPSNDYFIIGGYNNKEYEISLIDCTGKEVLNKKVTANRKIDISKLTSGIYIVTVTSNNKLTRKKVLLKY